MKMAGTEKQRSTEPRNTVTMGVTATQDSTSEWRELGAQVSGGHYVWIFTNLTSVAYVYSPSREAAVLEDVLAGFDGVLVSDFYGGYDAVPCRQQKCLIHLMRDINDELLKQPFDEELASIAREFGSLLREIVETVDRWGLKRHHLGKHRRAVKRFFGKVAAMPCSTESATALQRRIAKKPREVIYVPELRQCSLE